MYTPPHIVIVNHPGSGADDSALPKIAAALQRQAQEHFAPFYNLTCTVGVSTPAASRLPVTTPSDWQIGLFKDADQPGALGYHDTTPAGLPLAKVFPLLDAEDGPDGLSITLSHELLEMLADPWLTKCVQSSVDGKFWAYEVCDAVEADKYEIDGVPVSNFVTPAYFEPPSSRAGVKFDYLGLVRKPFEVRKGGYGQWHSASGGWHQLDAMTLAAHAGTSAFMDHGPRKYRTRTDKESRASRRRALLASSR